MKIRFSSLRTAKVRRAVERGVEVREHVDAREIDCELRVVACGWRSAELVPERERTFQIDAAPHLPAAERGA